MFTPPKKIFSGWSPRTDPTRKSGSGGGDVSKGKDVVFDEDGLKLSCVAFPSEDWYIADSTLPFWSSIASSILELDLHSEKRKSVEDVFFSIFAALFDALLLRAQVFPTITF
ncbi:hypothetical protein POM88_001463 [Heracleum sosnowskyi]|uniref:Uncharacterized protein n=1 Tax=Heracleum sosnowskyi TaxID=360622 RepID=A0AAD8JDL5_9APIA|nr:hypothetical protein POM88_001463 [Heracleum sosnowskyi]